MNNFEMLARQKKAALLAAAVKEYGYAELITYMEPIHWKYIASVAGVNPPSEETIALVREIVARHGSVSE